MADEIIPINGELHPSPLDGHEEIFPKYLREKCTDGVELKHPQISIDEPDSEASLQSPISPHIPSLLDVHPPIRMSSSPKSNSLPLGIGLESSTRALLSSNDVAESDTGSSDDQVSAVEQPCAEMGSSNSPKVHRSDSIDSELYDLEGMSSSSSEEGSSGTEPQLDSPTVPRRSKNNRISTEDDIFQDLGLEECSEADRKLVDWSYDMLKPSCRKLLQHCSADTVDREQVQTDLKSLANNISFFCNEHQRIGALLRERHSKGLSPSLSAYNFQLEGRLSGSRLHRHTKSSLTSISSDSSSSVYESQDLERSYAVKVLRSIMADQISPLIQCAALGFSPELYGKIVVAIQKISWQIEACLSFCACGPLQLREFDLHSEIFDEEEVARVRGMMIQARPPEEPKISIAARSSSVSVYRRTSGEVGAGHSGKVLYLQQCSNPQRCSQQLPGDLQCAEVRAGGGTLEWSCERRWVYGRTSICYCFGCFSCVTFDALPPKGHLRCSVVLFIYRNWPFFHSLKFRFAWNKFQTHVTV